MGLNVKIRLNNGRFLCDIYRIDGWSPLVTKQMLTSTGDMPRDELFQLLLALRFHEQDIHDAFDEAEGKSFNPKSDLGQMLEMAEAASPPPKAWRPSIISRIISKIRSNRL